jgi:uncharacterized membrane protein
MKPLFILLGVFVCALAGTRMFKSQIDVTLAGVIALSAMLLFTALGHFMFTRGMTAMLPDFVPFRMQLIYLTGLIEIAAAIGMFIPEFKKVTGILLIIFFILILPANIYAAIKHLNYETGQTDGKGLSYLWFRIPFQLLLIWWVYYFVLR